MASAENNKTGFATSTVVFGVVTTVLLLIAMTLFLQGGFQALQNRDYAAKIYGPVVTVADVHRAEQQAILNEGARWIDQDRGIVGLPIADAIDLFVAKNAAGTAVKADAAQ